jgi:Fic family protein
MDIKTTSHEGDLIASLVNALKLGEGDNASNTITRPEYEEACGVGKDKALREIRRLVKMGVLEPSMVQRTNIQGIRGRTHGYVFIEEEDDNGVG